MMLLQALRRTSLLDKRLSLSFRHHYFITFVCSGAVYRTYVSWNKQCSPSKVEVKSRGTSSLLCSLPSYVPSYVVYFGEDSKYKTLYTDDKSKQNAELRAEKLLVIKEWIENDLPTIFSRGIFDTINLFRPETILEIERTKGPSIVFRGSSQTNCVLALARSYFAAISTDRRIEVLGIEVDHTHWRIEVFFRVVLPPKPTREEGDLPPSQLIQRLESRAKWLDFRAIFHVSEKGDLTHVKITRMNRPRKQLLGVTLQKLRLAGNVVPMITDPIGVSLQLHELLSQLAWCFERQPDFDRVLLDKRKLEGATPIQLLEMINEKRYSSPRSSVLIRPLGGPIVSVSPYVLGLLSILSQRGLTS